MIKLYILNSLDWHADQLIYHSLPLNSIEALFIHTTSMPYVCIGYNYDIDLIDKNYCKKNKIPIFRREIGGGCVYLDSEQLLYHIVLNRENKLVPYKKEELFKKFLIPVLDTLEDIGLSGRIVNRDIFVNGKKISGNGGGEIEDFIVLGGNIIVDFDYERCANIFNFDKSKLYEAMKKNITTVRNELGKGWNVELLIPILVENFKNFFCGLEVEKLPKEVMNIANELKKKYIKKRWLERKRNGKKEIKVVEGVVLNASTSNN
ncbi:MAG: hypothetical protein AB1779_09775 [Candidatus Thermoplasmatota archaeon]